MPRILLPFLVLLGVVGIAVVSERPRPRADFTFINRGDVSILDLQRMSWMQDLRVARILFEGLVRNDVFSWDYEPLPGVAERWEVSEDGLTYTFHLRDNSRWVDGRGRDVAPVRAEDFVYAWRRGLLPDTVSDYISMFTLIEGGQEFYDWRQERLDTFKPDAGDGDASRPLEETAAGRLWSETLARFEEKVALRAIDDRTLEVRLVRPVPYFLDLCAFAVFYPVYPPLVRQYERPDRTTGRLDVQPGWTKPGVIVSNGPFVLTDWRFKRDLRLEKNPLYWARDTINVRSIEIPSIEDPNAQVLAFNSGSVDWVSEVTPSYRKDILAAKMRFYDECREHRRAWEEGGRIGPEPADIDRMIEEEWDAVAIDRALPPDPRKHIHAFPAFGTYFYNFNCLPRLPDGRTNPFSDRRVRQAFAMAIDKDRIARDVRGIGERVARTLIPPGSLGGYASPSGLPFDPEAARRLLAEAGFPGGKGFITVEILFNRDGGHDLIAQSIAKDWQENLGVNVELKMKEVKVFRNDLKRANFLTSRAGWYGDYGDPTTFLDLNRTGDGNNDRKFSNPAFDALLDRAAGEKDAAARLAILAEAERMIVEEELPMIPIFHYVQMSLFNPDRVSGISSHPRQEQNMFQADILGDGLGSERPLSLPPGKARMSQRTGVPEKGAAE